MASYLRFVLIALLVAWSITRHATLAVSAPDRHDSVALTHPTTQGVRDVSAEPRAAQAKPVACPRSPSSSPMRAQATSDDSGDTTAIAEVQKAQALSRSDALSDTASSNESTSASTLDTCTVDTSTPMMNSTSPSRRTVSSNDTCITEVHNASDEHQIDMYLSSSRSGLR